MGRLQCGLEEGLLVDGEYCASILGRTYRSRTILDGDHLSHATRSAVVYL